MKIVTFFVFSALVFSQTFSIGSTVLSNGPIVTKKADGSVVIGSEAEDVHIRFISEDDLKKLADAEKEAAAAVEKLEAVKLSIRKEHGDSSANSFVRHAICGAVYQAVEIKGRFAIVTKRASNDCPTITLTN